MIPLAVNFKNRFLGRIATGSFRKDAAVSHPGTSGPAPIHPLPNSSAVPPLSPGGTHAYHPASDSLSLQSRSFRAFDSDASTASRLDNLLPNPSLPPANTTPAAPPARFPLAAAPPAPAPAHVFPVLLSPTSALPALYGAAATHPGGATGNPPEGGLWGRLQELVRPRGKAR
jgi:hypothetical protein